MENDCRYQFLNFHFFFFLSCENTIIKFFFCICANVNAKKYFCGTLPFTAPEVNPTMMTSATKKPGNVKKVYYTIALHP